MFYFCFSNSPLGWDAIYKFCCRFFFIDKFGGGWGHAKLLLMDSLGAASLYAPSGRNFLEYGPVVVFDPKVDRKSVKLTASIFNFQNKI